MKALTMAWVVALGACGGGPAASGPADAGRVDIACTADGTFALTGRFAVLGLLNVHINASGLVETDTTSQLLLLMDTVHEGTEVAIVASLCSIEIPNVPISGQPRPIEFDVPPATVQSVAAVRGAGVLSSADRRCATVETDTFTIVLGARLSPIETAALPGADDAGEFAACAPTAATGCALAIGVNCACDQEGDGRPGATLRATNVPVVDLDEVYVTLRTRFRLEGVVIDSDSMLGIVEASIEQSILGCHAAAGAACTAGQLGSVKQLNPRITQQAGNPSSFRAIRVDEALGCEELVTRRDELFPL